MKKRYNRLLTVLLVFFCFSIKAATIYNIGAVNNTTITTCSGTLVDDGGVGGNYGSNQNFQVTICSPTATDHVRLDFNKLGLDPDGFSGDYIKIYDGPNTSSPLLTKIKSVDLPTALVNVFRPAYISSGSCLTVVFNSDFGTEAAGFEAEISCVTGAITKLGDSPSVTGCSGIITDNGGFNAKYSSGTKTTTICSGNSSSIRLDFLNVTEIDASDKLLIYDGNSTSAPLLRKMGDNFVVDSDGFTLLNYNINTEVTYDQIPVQSTGSCITVSFVASTLDHGRGFVISYSCANEQLKIPGNICETAPIMCDLNKFEGVTSSFYSRNLPGSGANQFCSGVYLDCSSNNDSMSVENNSWVVFIASAATATFKFSIPYCVYNSTGAQIRAFDYNDCTSFKKTNGVSPYITVDAGESKTLTCSGLTVGKKYIISVDGYGGNICGYTIEATAGTNTVNAGPDQTTCKDTTHLAATGTGSWKLLSSGGTPIIADTLSATTAISGLATGENKFKWSGLGSCALNNGDTVTITVTAGSGVTINYAGSPFLKTTVGTKTVTVSGGTLTGNFKVTPATGLSIDTVTGTITPSSSTKGTYIISAPTACGDAKDTIQITTCPTITPSTPNDVCLLDSTTSFAYTITDSAKFYSIVWDATALAAGFKNITDSLLPATSPLYIKVPSDTVVSVYNGKISVKDSLGCVSALKPIAVTIKKCICTKPSPPVLGPDRIYCKGDILATISTTGDSVKWFSDTAATIQIGSGLTFTPLNTVGKTSYYATQTVNGCQSDTAEIVVSIYNKPDISVSLHVNQPCPSLKGSVTLSASGGSGTPNWQYSKDNGNTYSASNFFNNLSPGDFTFRVKDDTSNCVKDTTLTIIAAPAFILAGPDSICKGDTAVLKATGVKPYTWNTNTPSADTLFSIVVTGNITVNVADSCNTLAPYQKTITIYSPPTLTVSANDTICTGDSTILKATAVSGSAPFVFAWTPLATLNNIKDINNTSSATLTPIFDSTYTHEISVTDNCNLKETKSISIKVNAKPEIEIIAADAICQNETITLNNSKHSATMTKYLWNFGSTNTSDIEKTSAVITIPGIYYITLKVTDNIGCVNVVIDTFEVIKNPITIITPSAMEKSIFNPVILFDGSNSHDNIKSYLWNIGDLASDTLQKTNYTFADTGNYQVSLNVKNEKIIKGNSYYCYDSTQITVRINDELALYIPNTFSPNNDGQNDLFSPKGVGFTKYEMRIFDRWGQEVFYANDIENAWNGNNKNGNYASEDVYVYLIKVMPSNKSQGEKTFTGHVTLLR